MGYGVWETDRGRHKILIQLSNKNLIQNSAHSTQHTPNSRRLETQQTVDRRERIGSDPGHRTQIRSGLMTDD
jgi:hypothetical protein